MPEIIPVEGQMDDKLNNKPIFSGYIAKLKLSSHEGKAIVKTDHEETTKEGMTVRRYCLGDEKDAVKVMVTKNIFDKSRIGEKLRFFEYFNLVFELKKGKGREKNDVQTYNNRKHASDQNQLFYVNSD